MKNKSIVTNQYLSIRLKKKKKLAEAKKRSKEFFKTPQPEYYWDTLFPQKDSLDVFDLAKLSTEKKQTPYAIARKLSPKMDFVVLRDELFVYNEQYYQKMDESKSLEIVKNNIAEDYRYDLSDSKIKQIVSDLKCYDSFHKNQADEFHQLISFINFNNGILDLKTKILRESSPHYQFLSKIPRHYAKFKKFSNGNPFANFIDTLCEGSAPKIRQIQVIIGLALSNIRTLKYGFFIEGKKNVGKSVLLNLIRHLIGVSNCSALSLSELVREFSTCELSSSVVNLYPEMKANDLKKIELLKSLIGNNMDTVAAKQKFKKLKVFTPRALHIFTGNILPKIPAEFDPDGAFRSRMYIIQLFHSIPKEEQDETLFSKMLGFLDEIAAWAVEGIYYFNKKGLPEMEPYIEMDNDEPIVKNFKIFIQDCCVFEESAWSNSSELFKAYQCFLDANQLDADLKYNVTTFSTQLKQMPSIKQSEKLNQPAQGRVGRGFYGIKLHDHAEL